MMGGSGNGGSDGRKDYCMRVCFLRLAGLKQRRYYRYLRVATVHLHVHDMRVNSRALQRHVSRLACMMLAGTIDDIMQDLDELV